MAARNAFVTVTLHATARVSQKVRVVVPYDDVRDLDIHLDFTGEA